MGFLLPEPMVNHCAVKVSTTQIFFHGGLASDYPADADGLSRTYLLNVTDGTFTAGPNSAFKYPESVCGYVVQEEAQNPRVIVVGGLFPDTGLRDRVESFDLTTNEWSEVTPLPEELEPGALTIPTEFSFQMIGGTGSERNGVLEFENEGNAFFSPLESDGRTEITVCNS